MSEQTAIRESESEDWGLWFDDAYNPYARGATFVVTYAPRRWAVAVLGATAVALAGNVRGSQVADRAFTLGREHPGCLVAWHHQGDEWVVMRPPLWAAVRALDYEAIAKAPERNEIETVMIEPRQEDQRSVRFAGRDLQLRGSSVEVPAPIGISPVTQGDVRAAIRGGGMVVLARSRDWQT